MKKKEVLTIGAQPNASRLKKFEGIVSCLLGQMTHRAQTEARRRIAPSGDWLTASVDSVRVYMRALVALLFDEVIMIVIIFASIAGTALTFALLWPKGIVMAVVCAPVGGSSLALAACMITSMIGREEG